MPKPVGNLDVVGRSMHPNSPRFAQDELGGTFGTVGGHRLLARDAPNLVGGVHDPASHDAPDAGILGQRVISASPPTRNNVAHRVASGPDRFRSSVLPKLGGNSPLRPALSQSADIYRSHADSVRTSLLWCYIGTTLFVAFVSGIAGQTRRIRGVVPTITHSQVESYASAVSLIILPVTRPRQLIRLANLDRSASINGAQREGHARGCGGRRWAVVKGGECAFAGLTLALGGQGFSVHGALWRAGNHRRQCRQRPIVRGWCVDGRRRPGVPTGGDTGRPHPREPPSHLRLRQNLIDANPFKLVMARWLCSGLN